MEYADGGLYQQSALSGALNKPGFPSRSDLSCHHFMLAWAIGGVVSVLLIKQQALIIGAQYSRSLARSAHTVRAFLLANATEALLFRRAISWLAQLDTASCLCLADCNTALAPWISKVLK
jgi:hypothetical protein